MSTLRIPRTDETSPAEEPLQDRLLTSPDARRFCEHSSAAHAVVLTVRR